MNNRYYGEKINTDKESIIEFFKGRTKKISDTNEILTTVLYQDSNPEIAIKRDKEEKDKLRSLLNLSTNDKVLDIGCGIGRWSEFFNEFKVHSYHGVDFTDEFIDYANKTYKYNNQFTFQVMDVSYLNQASVENFVPYSCILISGVLMYLNDDVLENVLNNLYQMCDQNCTIIIREPISIEQRLTLNKITSDELKQTYSATYRTVNEYKDKLTQFTGGGFYIMNDSPLYRDELNNRKETRQHLFILRREHD